MTSVDVPAHVVLRRRARDDHGRADQPQRDAGEGRCRSSSRSTAGSSTRAPVTIEPNASGSVTFAAVTVAAPACAATVRAGTDALRDRQRLPFRAVAEPAGVGPGDPGRGRGADRRACT